jgi:hypothetical protein
MNNSWMTNNAMGHLEPGAGENNPASTPRAASLVTTLSLDQAAEKLRVVPHVIKIDVEGAELRVLEGARNLLTHARPHVLLSVHSDELRESCLSYLREKKYEAEPLNGQSLQAATEFVIRAFPS